VTRPDFLAGLTSAQIPELFEKYKQMRPGRSGGSGLGLVLAQQIANAFGSDIVVKSPWQKDGQPGTCMEMLLRDCITEEEEELDHASIDVAGLELAEAKVDDFAVARALRGVLIVEDEKMNQMVRRSHSRKTRKAVSVCVIQL